LLLLPHKPPPKVKYFHKKIVGNLKRPFEGEIAKFSFFGLNIGKTVFSVLGVMETPLFVIRERQQINSASSFIINLKAL